MKKMHIKKGDTVIVLTGEDKGKTGKVLQVLKEKEQAIVGKLRFISQTLV